VKGGREEGAGVRQEGRKDKRGEGRKVGRGKERRDEEIRR
jgi:hypothetical protein